MKFYGIVDHSFSVFKVFYKSLVSFRLEVMGLCRFVHFNQDECYRESSEHTTWY